jgi:hypothetical protein
MDWMRSDPRQDVGEPGLWIHVVHFGRDNQAVHHAAHGSFRGASGTEALTCLKQFAAQSPPGLIRGGLFFRRNVLPLAPTHIVTVAES